MEDLRSVLSRDKVVHQLMWASLCLGASGSSHVSGEAGHKADLTCVTCMCLWGWERASADKAETLKTSSLGHFSSWPILRGVNTKVVSAKPRRQEELNRGSAWDCGF